MGLPERMNFLMFESFFINSMKKVFFDTSALRLAMCHTQPSMNGKKLAHSFACITILEFLTDKEKIAV